ncbi:MAG: hypothetical protein IKM97_01425 [Clostridia bacterium]|nr:hypothetical protein [Clostridia bacterium]
MSTTLSFKQVLDYLYNHQVFIDSFGKLSFPNNISFSVQDFDNEYISDIHQFFIEHEADILNEENQSEKFWKDIDAISSPVLLGTCITKKLESFFSHLLDNYFISSTSLLNTINKLPNVPVFLLSFLYKTSSNKKNKTLNFPLPEELREKIPSSEELMDGYGTKYSGTDILYFANMDLIDDENPIKMLIFDSLYTQDISADNYIQPVSYEKLLSFYSPKRLHKLLKLGKINSEFTDLFIKLLGGISEEQKTEYFQNIISETKRINSASNFLDSEEKKSKNRRRIPLNDGSTDLLEFSNLGIIPYYTLYGNISTDFIKSSFNSGNLPITGLLDIVERAKEDAENSSFNDLQQLITPESVISLELTTFPSSTPPSSKGTIHNNPFHRALDLMTEQNKKALFYQTNSLQTIMYIFLHYETISINELNTILKNRNNQEHLDVFIEKGSLPSKIKELYESYLIDYGCIKTLIEKGILTKDEVQKFRLGISVFDTINDRTGRKKVEINSNLTNVPFSTTGTFLGKQADGSNDNLNQLYQILGDIDNNDLENFPTISSENKENGFLNGYKVLPLKQVSLIALLPPNAINSIYVMTAQEFAYIYKNKALPHNFDSNKAIKEIRSSKTIHEDFLLTVSRFEEAISYLNSLGYKNDLNFSKVLEIMYKNYLKIKYLGGN